MIIPNGTILLYDAETPKHEEREDYYGYPTPILRPGEPDAVECQIVPIRQDGTARGVTGSPYEAEEWAVYVEDRGDLYSPKDFSKMVRFESPDYSDFLNTYTFTVKSVERLRAVRQWRLIVERNR